ncbi:TetR/AcrR family transcriptional regulator [Pseudonocardia sp. KRD-291]|nr:TetR/AcrR family transcriptional regulator [Pseudonocardia sp. KRD291]
MSRTDSATEDPRRARSREAMVGAAMRLLASAGPGAVTPARVAAEAGVHRATAYRLWPDADKLLAEVMAETELPFLRDPVTPVRAWLRGCLRELADDLATPLSRSTTTTLMQTALHDARVATRRDALTDTLRARIDAAQNVAVAEGELVDRQDPDHLVAMLVGPLLYRTTLEAATVDDTLIDHLIDRAFPSPSTTGHKR